MVITFPAKESTGGDEGPGEALGVETESVEFKLGEGWPAGRLDVLFFLITGTLTACLPRLDAIGCKE